MEQLKDKYFDGSSLTKYAHVYLIKEKYKFWNKAKYRSQIWLIRFVLTNVSLI